MQKRAVLQVSLPEKSSAINTNSRSILCLVLYLFSVLPLYAASLYVDNCNVHGPWNGSLEFPYRYIQQAIDAASGGAQILIASGTYYENLVISGKELEISARPRAVVVIDGQQLGSVVTIFESDVHLERLTVTNGLAEFGGGMNIDLSSVVLSRVTVTGNRTRDGQDGTGPGGAGANAGSGGGIYATTSAIGVSFSTISRNSTGTGGNAVIGSAADGGYGGSGGGLYAIYGSVSLDDCTITENTTGDGGDGGLAESSQSYGGQSGSGAGLCIQWNDYIQLNNCDIADNVIGSGGDASMQGGNTGDGGGAYILGYGPTRIMFCRFLRNSAGIGGYAEWGGESGHGGGAYIGAASLAEIGHCEFANNVGGFGGDGWDHGGDGGHGGGVFIGGLAATLTNCTITGNRSGQGQGKGKGGSGGGLYAFAEVSLGNCLVAHNTASGGSYVDYDGNGGGICATENLTVTACTIADNSVENSGADAIGRGGGIFGEAAVNVTNSILWDNKAYFAPLDVMQVDAAALTVNYTCLEGFIWGGSGNMWCNPYFVDAGSNDYHLRSVYGHWDIRTQSWVLDWSHSPCIDAGDPYDMNWLNELWPHGRRVNMGAYGGTPQASKSDWLVGNVADIDRDDAIDIADLVQLAGKWLQTAVLCPEDMNFDGNIDMEDFALLGANWTVLVY